MANPESKQLAVDIIARVDKLEKGLAKAKKAANDNYRQIEQRTKTFSGRIEHTMAGAANKVGGLFKNFAAGFLGGIAAGGIAGLVHQLGDVAEGIATIGDRAKQAGLDSDDFQKIAFVAEQNRIEVDDLTSGIREMQLRMNEFITSAGKSGTAAETLNRLGYTVDTIRDKLKNPLDLFTEIVGKVEQLDRASQIRIFDDIFGGDGERLVRIISEGERGIRAQIKAAEDLGIVLSDDVIAKAQEIDRQFNVITTTVSTHLKKAIVDAASALGEFIDSFNDFENQRTTTLDSRLAAIGEQRLDLENKILKLQGEQRDAAKGNPFGFDYDSALKTLTDERAALGEEEQRILKILGNRTTNLPPVTVTTTPPGTGGSPGGGSRSSSGSAMKEQRDRAKDLIASLEEELRLVGATDAERAKSNALRLAGADATTTQKDRIAELVTQIYAETEAHEKAADAARELNDIGRDATRTLIDGFVEGKKAGEVFADVLSDIASRLEDMALDALFPRGGGGLLSALLGGGFGGGSSDPWAGLRLPGRASGGPVQAGMPYIVGEKRPELFVPNTSGMIVPRVPTMPAIARTGGGGSTPVNINVAIDAKGADREGLARVENQVAKLKAELPAHIVAGVRKAQKSNVKL